ncbi:hypothetical protein ACI3KS_18730 [Microbacterium sp. ZW T5_45]|uniref:hypothetical protein n=1 Tax=Microbacterium sp. ZW T5_45 TaxID=3378080 RepID=UPI003853CFAB
MNPESTPIDQLAAPYLDKGFIEVDDDGRDVVVIQFPMRNSAYDCRLIERATEWLDVFLDERGLGFVDGHDRGARAGDGKIVINIFARVVDGELGATAGMAASRKGAADAAHATIAHHAADADDWTLRYERTSGKLPGAFRV